VLSTYHTISYESSDKKSPIWQIKWFRVILDEGKSQCVSLPKFNTDSVSAHIIRRMSTRLFKTMKKLRAKIYWCLTGTPVQNSLEDLAALLSFIRTSPLDDLLKFRKHIISPLTKGSENGVENLRQLLDSVCLRRTKQLLHLPEAIFELQQLRFSVKEEQQYNETRDKLVKLIHKNGLKAKHQKGYLGVLQLQLQLRRFCNHGTFQKASLGTDEFDPDQAIALLKKQKIAKCEACSVNITGIKGIEETCSGSFTVCGHLLCMKCVPKMKSALKLVDGRDGCFQCSLCPEVVFGDYLIGEAGTTKSTNHGSKSLSAWQYFDKEGCSTKVSAVVTDIEHHRTPGKR
jgi:SNF2 family DNA or RNA helicase